jgi:hypothetical protein
MKLPICTTCPYRAGRCWYDSPICWRCRKVYEAGRVEGATSLPAIVPDERPIIETPADKPPEEPPVCKVKTDEYKRGYAAGYSAGRNAKGK